MIAAAFQAWMVVGICIGVIAIFALMILDAQPYDDEGRPIKDSEFTDWADWDFPNHEPSYYDDWGYDEWEENR